MSDIITQLRRSPLALLSNSIVFAQSPPPPMNAPTPPMETLDPSAPRTDVTTLPGDADTLHIISESASTRTVRFPVARSLKTEKESTHPTTATESTTTRSRETAASEVQ